MEPRGESAGPYLMRVLAAVVAKTGGTVELTRAEESAAYDVTLSIPDDGPHVLVITAGLVGDPVDGS